MQPIISVITLAVDDLVQATKFYHQGLGLPTKGVVGEPEQDTQVAFFKLNNNLKLALWPRESLQRQTSCAVTGHGVLISHNVVSREAAEQLLRKAAAAGAVVNKAAHEQPWGCFGGYFTDPEGYLWEVTFNPDLVSKD
ncbi:VOC family protein [Idiomarina seosinensis]|uniref:VOC family protein n=1 Tax=Idiomarina seosinensis TaxID=281739 RepID=UPI00384DF063